jgi:hypothetical protein
MNENSVTSRGLQLSVGDTSNHWLSLGISGNL